MNTLLLLVAAAGFVYQAADDMPDLAVERGGALMVPTEMGANRREVPLKYVGELIGPCGEITVRLEGELPQHHSITGACLLLQVRPGRHGRFQKRENLVKLPAEVVGAIPESGNAAMCFRVSVAEIVRKLGEAFPLKLSEVLFLRSAGAPAATYHLKTLRCERGGTVLDFVAGEDGYNIVDLDRADVMPPRFEIANESAVAEPRRVRFVCRATDERTGAEVARYDTERMLVKGDPIVFDLPRPTRAGAVVVDYALTDLSAGGYAATNRVSYAAMRPTGSDDVYPTEGFLFSCLAHFGSYNINERRRMIGYLQRMGANHVRASEYYWQNAEPTAAGEWKGFKRFYNTCRQCADAHVELHMGVNCPPKWTLMKEGEFAGMPDPAETERYARDLAAKMKGVVRYFEGENEPNLRGSMWSNGVWLARHERAIWRGLHAGNPEAKYISGEWGGFNRWPENYYDELNRGDFDIWGHHYHGEFPSARNVVGHIGEIYRRTGMTKPWFGDECATCDTNGVRAAATMFKKYMHAWMNGAMGMTWYNLRNKGCPNPVPPGEMSFGLLTYEFGPKLTYVAFNAMSGAFRGAECRGAADLGLLTMGALMTRAKDDAALYPMWVQSSKCREVTLRAATAATSAEIVDLFGNVTPAAVVGGEIVFTVGKEPQTLRLHPQSARLSKVVEVSREEIASYNRAVCRSLKRPAEFRAANAETYTQLSVFCGENDDLVWQGPRDCSGYLTAFMPVTQLHLRVVAIDDIHHPGSGGRMQYDGDGVQVMMELPGQIGGWEFGVAATGRGGEAECYVWSAPNGFDAVEMARKFRVSAKRGGSMRDGWRVDYDIVIQLSDLRLDRALLMKEGLRINAIINDNDGRKREGYMSFVEGDAKDPENFLTVEYEEAK